MVHDTSNVLNLRHALRLAFIRQLTDYSVVDMSQVSNY